MNWRKINNVVHRDFGYFFVFMTLIYSISGIAINHADDWNPDFYVEKQEVKLDLPKIKSEINEELVLKSLGKIDQAYGFLMIDHPSEEKIKIYFKNGSLLYDLKSGYGKLERVSRRPIFYEVNFMHRNPGGLWTWVSDIFAFSLIVLAITGLFILKGKKGIKGRGKWLVGSGVILTIVFMFFLIN